MAEPIAPASASRLSPPPDLDGRALVIVRYRAMTTASTLPRVMTDGPPHLIQAASPSFMQLVPGGHALEGRPLADVLTALGGAAVIPLLDEVAHTCQPTMVADSSPRHLVTAHGAWTYTLWPIWLANTPPCGVLLDLTTRLPQVDHAQDMDDTRAINEQLLLAGLREQELAEHLQLQLAFSDAITRSLGEGVYAFDQAGQVTYVNPMAERLVGRSAADLLGQPAGALLDVLPAPTAVTADLPDPFLAVLATRTAYRHDQASVRHPDGGVVPLTVTIAPMISAATVLGGVVVFRDLSEIRRLEALREEYLALLSHDVRSPLTAILLAAQRLHRTQGPEATKESRLVTMIIESGLRIDHLLKDVLSQSALEGGATAMQREELDLVPLIRRMVGLLPLADQARMQLDLAATVPMQGDAAQLERVVVNLLTNALKYSAAVDPVVVRVTMADQQALLSVRDLGVGIDAEDLPHVFEKHYRARTAGTVAGTGLGLYSSHLIVLAHGGRMGIESRVGHGCTVTIRLPLMLPSR